MSKLVFDVDFIPWRHIIVGIAVVASIVVISLCASCVPLNVRWQVDPCEVALVKKCSEFCRHNKVKVKNFYSITSNYSYYKCDCEGGISAILEDACQ
jgi:hypothetical protein